MTVNKPDLNLILFLVFGSSAHRSCPDEARVQPEFNLICSYLHINRRRVKDHSVGRRLLPCADFLRAIQCSIAIIYMICIYINYIHIYKLQLYTYIYKYIIIYMITTLRQTLSFHTFFDFIIVTEYFNHIYIYISMMHQYLRLRTAMYVTSESIEV